MGSSEQERATAMKSGSQKAWLARETPQHWVSIAYPFALARHPVTVGQWRQFARATGWESMSDTDWSAPGFAQTDEHPVVAVSWNDVQKYLTWLTAKTGQLYRLPSEAEWEYACRAGTHTAFSFGDDISTERANYDGNFTYNNGIKGEFRQGTTRVDAFPARRVLRGGSWLYQPRYLRSALRNGYSAVLANDIVGFRVARKLS
jgi:formylglycine-generating enzyme required for sulfatase activity